MIKLIVSIVAFCWANTIFSQSILTIDSCYAMAKRNYPIVKQMALIEKTNEYSLENANKGFLPQFSINGQATYQSEVTEVPINMPGVNITPLSRDQYKLYGEVNQPITDLFTVKQHKNFIDANSQIEEQKIEVELYKLKERINNLFFGILLIDAQLAQTEIMRKDIQSGMDKTTVAIENGVAIKGTLNNLKVELLKLNQRATELKSTRKGYADILSFFIGNAIEENTTLEKPSPQVMSNTINRPELQLFELEKQKLGIQNKLINAKTLPRFSLFIQGGLGRPALNMLSNDFKGYYIGGLRLNWNLSSFYTSGKEKKILEINQNGLDVQRELFLFNTNLVLRQQNTEIEKMQELINSDSEIVELRETIQNTTKNQLEFGTATTNDYMIAVNAKDQAKQNLVLHEIQLLLTQYNYQSTTGN